MVLQSSQDFAKYSQPDPDQALPAQSPLVKLSRLAMGNEKGGQDTNAKSQVKHDLMRVKVRCVVTKVGVEGEVRIWVAPRGIWFHRQSSWHTVPDRQWDSQTSRKRPDLDGVASFIHDEKPTAAKVEWEAVGCVARRVGELDSAPFVEFDCGVAIIV